MIRAHEVQQAGFQVSYDELRKKWNTPENTQESKGTKGNEKMLIRPYSFKCPIIALLQCEPKPTFLAEFQGPRTGWGGAIAPHFSPTLLFSRKPLPFPAHFRDLYQNLALQFQTYSAVSEFASILC